VLAAFAMDMPAPAQFGRIHHLPEPASGRDRRDAADRGCGDGRLVSEPAAPSQGESEALTDDLAANPYESREHDERVR